MERKVIVRQIVMLFCVSAFQILSYFILSQFTETAMNILPMEPAISPQMKMYNIQK